MQIVRCLYTIKLYRGDVFTHNVTDEITRAINHDKLYKKEGCNKIVASWICKIEHKRKSKIIFQTLKTAKTEQDAIYFKFMQKTK